MAGELHSGKLQLQAQKKYLKRELTTLKPRLLAIGDTKCAEILKLENKKERRDKIKNYFDELVDNALNNFCFNIDEISKNSLDSIKENVNKIMKNNEESIENIKKEIEENMKLSESEIEAKRKEYDRKEEIINNLLETIKL